MALPRVERLTGLGVWLALTFIALSVALTALLTGLASRASSEQVRERIGANLSELAFQTTSRLDRSMFERYREVELLSKRLSQVGDLVEARRELDLMQTSYPLYSWVGLTDMEGRVQVATSGLLEGQSVSARPWFRNALQGIHMGDVHEAQLLSQLLLRPGDAPLRFVDIAFPVLGPDGQPRGVVGAHLSWEWARDIERAIFSPIDGQRSVQALIVARDGKVLQGPTDLIGQRLALPSLAAADRATHGRVQEVWPDGRSYLVGFSSDRGLNTYPGMGWRVLVREDIDLAYAPVRALQLELLIGGLASALMVSALGWGLARLIARPLRSLTKAAQGLEAGGAVRVPMSTAYAEVARLGRALKTLVHKLQVNELELRELNANLEQRVTERTAELSDAFERLKSDEQRIEALLEMAQDPFVGMDFFGRITDWNSAAEKLLGWRSEEVIGQLLSEVVVPERYRAGVNAALQTFLNSGQAPFVGQRIERLVMDKLGREIPVEMRISLIDTPKVRLFSAFLHDMRERKEVERLKSEFVSTVSHELRTPLTAIYGSLNMLASGMAGELSNDVRELVQLANDSCERLLRLVNDLLDIERMDAGNVPYDMRRQPIESLVAAGVRDTRPYADNLGVSLRLLSGADAMVMADGDRIVQVVVNLLSNAAKFSPTGGIVDVSITVRAGMVRVSVIDQGPGIPDAFRDRIFRRFAQADGSDRRQKGGTGLGLAICRSIVQAHEGRIDFTSQPGRTEFFFELPLA